jgi:hypothetical protein
VESYYIGLPGYFIERYEALPAAKPLGLLAGRIGAQHPESPHSPVFPHKRTDMADTRYAETSLPRAPSASSGKQRQSRPDPLQHASGVASRRRGDLDTAGAAIFHIDMIEPYGRRTYEADAGTLQQRLIAPGTGTHQQSVCIGNVTASYQWAGQIHHLPVWF